MVRRKSLNDRVESNSGCMKCAKDAVNQAYLSQIPRIELDTVLKPRSNFHTIYNRLENREKITLIKNEKSIASNFIKQKSKSRPSTPEKLNFKRFNKYSIQSIISCLYSTIGEITPRFRIFQIRRYSKTMLYSR